MIYLHYKNIINSEYSACSNSSNTRISSVETYIGFSDHSSLLNNSPRPAASLFTSTLEAFGTPIMTWKIVPSALLFSLRSSMNAKNSSDHCLLIVVTSAMRKHALQQSIKLRRICAAWILNKPTLLFLHWTADIQALYVARTDNAMRLFPQVIFHFWRTLTTNTMAVFPIQS